MKAIPAQTLSLLPEQWLQRWRLLAFRNKAAETTLYALLLSGLPLWSVLAADWSLTRWSLLLHGVLGLLLFPTVVMPFWMAHRQLLARSQKVFLKRTGQMLDSLLALVAVSGFYLLLIGSRGDLPGYWMHQLHLLSSLVLAPLLLRHAWRWSVLRLSWRWISTRKEPA